MLKSLLFSSLLAFSSGSSLTINKTSINNLITNLEEVKVPFLSNVIKSNAINDGDYLNNVSKVYTIGSPQKGVFIDNVDNVNLFGHFIIGNVDRYYDVISFPYIHFLLTNPLGGVTHHSSMLYNDLGVPFTNYEFFNFISLNVSFVSYINDFTVFISGLRVVSESIVPYSGYFNVNHGRGLNYPNVFFNNLSFHFYDSYFNYDYSDGYSFGYSLGYTNGLNDGNSAFYDSGFADGENYGFANGVEVGFIDGYTSGYDVGFSGGFNDGYIDGNNEGLLTGYDNGYSMGFNDGVGSDFNAYSWLTGIFSALGGLLSIQLLPNVSLGGILILILVLTLLPFLIGLLKGGKG